jgi:hypothetical protein
MTKPGKLAATMQSLLTVTEKDPAWPAIIDDIGVATLCEIIMTLRIVYARYYCGTPADLAEQAKAKAVRAKRLN